MNTITRIQAVRAWIAAAFTSINRLPPTAGECGGGGALVTPEAFDLQLHDIGERWSCWAQRGESVDAHRWRLQLHLQSLQITIEDDLAAVLQERRPLHA